MKFDDASNVAGLVDVISSVTLIFILVASILTIIVYEKTAALEKAKNNILLLEDCNRYRLLANSLKQELERKHSEKIIIPNELKGKVLFDNGKAEILDEFSSTLHNYYKMIRDSLESHRFNYVQIEGHTDNVPIWNNEFHSNWELGFARAMAVLRYMESSGINPKYLSATSYSFYKPKNMKGRSQNRRIEIVLLKK